jgi:hypothetical protein
MNLNKLITVSVTPKISSPNPRPGKAKGEEKGIHPSLSMKTPKTFAISDLSDTYSKQFLRNLYSLNSSLLIFSANNVYQAIYCKLIHLTPVMKFVDR